MHPHSIPVGILCSLFLLAGPYLIGLSVVGILKGKYMGRGFDWRYGEHPALARGANIFQLLFGIAFTTLAIYLALFAT